MTFIQLLPSSIYLEEEISKHDKFPLAGKFSDLSFGRYEVCGDPSTEADQMPRNTEGYSTPQSSSRPWSITRPWTNTGQSTSHKKRGTASTAVYEKFLKRNIPFVSLIATLW